MLSVRRRQEDAGGAAGMADHAELEEGEAYGDDIPPFDDPDVTLAYIDEKLQNVLGHFQKDFEGGVSAENLGSKFGGYGSFLPTYQRSPLPPHTRTPPKVANTSSRSPYHQSTEDVSQNPPAMAVPSASQNNGSVAPFSGDSVKKERCESTASKRGSSTHDPSNGPSKSSDQNRFKVRIKVGSDNVLARNNAAIYSGLGLDISSPSSVEESPDGHGDLSPEFSNVQLESPRTILQIMTCFSVPGGYLLSPLHGSLLQLTKKVVPSLKKWETSLEMENAQEAFEGHVVKKMKPDGKKKKPTDTKRSNNRNDISAFMKNEIDIETLAAQKIASEALSIPLLSSPRSMDANGNCQFKEEAAGKSLERNKDDRLKECAVNSNSKTIKAETVKEETSECLESGGFGSSELELSAAKRELKPVTEKTPLTLEEMNTTSDTDFLLDRKHERKIKPESKSNASVVNFEENAVIDEKAPAVCRSMEKVPSKEASLYDTNVKNNTKSEAKRIQREQKKNAPTSSDLVDVDKGARSSAGVKERKNDSHSKSSHSGKKPKAKPHRDVRDSLPDGPHGSKEEWLDLLENGVGLGELQPKEKSWSKRDSDMPGASKREISSSAKLDRHTASEEQKMHVPPSSVSTANAAPALQAPVVIEEHWVQCDICQKWRLLPYESDPATLPKEWKCSMQLWLPGLNRCDVGEEETTNALNALYVIPPPANGIPSVGHPHAASSGLATASTFSINGHAEQSRKRKSFPGDGSALVDSSHPTQAPAYSTITQPPPRIKSTADSNHYPSERDSVSKLVDISTEKKKSKSKNRGSYSDGGDLVERSKKHSKGKGKREMDYGEYKASKKIKKEERHRSSRDRNPECDLASGDVPDEAKSFLAKAKSSGEKADISSLKQKSVSRSDRLEKSKREKDEDIALPEDGNKEQYQTSDVQRSDVSSKKRIVKEWEESQHNSIAQVNRGTTVNHSSAAKETHNDQNLKETKSKSMKSEELYSATDSKLVKGLHSNQISSYYGGHVNNELVEDSTHFAGKRGPSEVLEKRSSEHVLDLAGATSSGVAFFPTTAITSSSSKASCSQKKKNNSQVVKTSPIESVSSSPPRNSNIDKFSHNRIVEKDGPMNANPGTMPSSVKYLNTEVDIVDNVRQTKKSKESLLASEPVLHGSSQGNSDKDDELVQLTQGHASERISLRKGLDDDQQHASGRKDSTVNGSSTARGYNHLHSGDKNNLRTDGSLVQPRTAASGSKGDLTVSESKKTAAPVQDRNGSTHCALDGNPKPEVPSGKDKFYPKSNKQDMEKPKAQIAPSPLKETHSTPVKSNASKLTPQSRRSNDENGGQQRVAKQGTSNPTDGKDGNSTAYALKEARDLKHKANRLKKEGKELESTRLYFEAALKFLHVASLLEPPGIDGLKQGDAAQSMYSDTAKLCNFVGHEYERGKKMAAAALAYKCVEVAYLKAAYYKYPIASKDRQVLQAVVQTTPGESPSSSASDIDNLNHNGLSKMAASNKDANSPQVAGNHLLLAVRNQPHLTRLLAYTNDVNSAFEATRKSQMAIASAAGNHEKGVDGLSSVKTVLDFNFRSVNDLLRLVRISMESISC
ncbi:cysteine-tryptophan domain-containing zinc finger protein 7-like [Hordeum vulgare subsp. vulgare]|uniref:cysteine-tryptophan domain-containing zinc finger protein 7-like n=1 Tax=Hordeum vulgare subsp. vulgare TaxID=112509 RepID=UPI000294F8A4|nr:cysteine-tryptophan domain-containing zinc finger protein 7-like [Hordeum vulgare subsp. vulgare]XP_044964412.1 cysteine-tryptophan domain-containing zinc finger protein 7-like [Hordeum vulgare subsp. vulgare]